MFRAALLSIIALACAVPAQAVNVTAIRVTNTQGLPLQIAELQAFQGLINVAPRAVATASSALFGFTGPDKVNDGLTDGQPYGGGVYISDTSDPAPYLLLTFSRTYNITRLQVFGREDCCQNRDVFDFEFIYHGVSTPMGTIDVSGQGLANTNAMQFAAAAVPEPAQWALLIGGFALTGGAMRRRRSAVTYA
ncbi:hypothetical protein SPAN111604_10060 [Sphingomonas antarctica]|uniref:PEPxxWA-CTERM sorting domain-containing protein n=1 Tax=Sphingomonas antarctica TaxID=2040274 RepID=UPI0039E819CF